MPSGGRRDGAGRPRISEDGELMDTHNVTLPARDMLALSALGNGNISAAVRDVLAFWRANRDKAYAQADDQHMVKQVTLYTKDVEGLGLRYFVDVYLPDDQETQSFSCADESTALSYAADLMRRDLKPLDGTHLLADR